MGRGSRKLGEPAGGGGSMGEGGSQELLIDARTVMICDIDLLTSNERIY